MASDIGERSSAGAGYVSSDTERVADTLYHQAALPFEIASMLMLVAMVGAVLLARGKKQELYYDEAPDEARSQGALPDTKQETASEELLGNAESLG